METPSARPTPPFSPNGTTAMNPPNLKPLTLNSQSGPRPLQLASSNFSTTSASSRPSLSRSNSTKSTPRDRAFPQNAKRLSSISYSSSSPTQPLASPFNPNPSFALPDASSGRNQSASPPTRGTPLQKDSAEPLVEGSEETTAERSTSTMTLSERHADLLRFIAAKESKCLELRTQLEQHESELTQLKRKWERVVNKAKPSELGLSDSGHSTNSGGDAVGDAVVGALKGVGRLLGGLGTIDTPSLVPKPPEPVFEAAPIASETPPIPSRSSLDGPPPKANPVASPTRSNSISKRALHRYRRPSSSISSPTSSANPPSTRDSLSSVSTASSSVVDDLVTTSAEPTPTHTVAYPWAEAVNPSPVVDTHEAGSWMPAMPDGLNKKWEQLQKTSTFERHSKRASVLLSDVTDMSSTILGSLSSVLLSPTASSQPSPKLKTWEGLAVPPRSRTQTSSSSSVSSSGTPRPLSSLLDDDEDGAGSPCLSKPILPSASSRSELKTSPPTALEAEDDWNW